MVETIKIGPYHPALLEPQVFNVTVKDGKITNVDMELGYAHRSIEKLMTTKTYNQNVFLAERVCGICSAAHSTVYCETVEKLFDVQIPERARYIRTIFFELERLESHYLILALLSHSLHEEEYFGKILSERELLMDLFELTTGNRVHYAFNKIGGVQVDLTPKTIQKTKSVTTELRKLSNHILQAFRDKGAFTPKIKGKGTLTKEKALALGAVGPTLRGSGVKSDTRKDDPYAAYVDLNFEAHIGSDGDIYDRHFVRAKETIESIRIIEQALDNLPRGPIQEEVGAPLETQALGRVEAPRGELIYFVKSDGTDVPELVKIRTPSFANNYSYTEMFLNQELADFQLVLESTDPCFSCTDRLTIVDQGTGKKELVSFSALERRE